MSQVIVNGQPYAVEMLTDENLVPGTCVREYRTRKALRIVCQDGTDLVLRNMRHPDLLEVVPIERATYYLKKIVPVNK